MSPGSGQVRELIYHLPVTWRAINYANSSYCSKAQNGNTDAAQNVFCRAFEGIRSQTKTSFRPSKITVAALR